MTSEKIEAPRVENGKRKAFQMAGDSSWSLWEFCYDLSPFGWIEGCELWGNQSLLWRIRHIAHGSAWAILAVVFGARYWVLLDNIFSSTLDFHPLLYWILGWVAFTVEGVLAVNWLANSDECEWYQWSSCDHHHLLNITAVIITFETALFFLFKAVAG